MSEGRSHLWPGVPLALGSAALFGAVPPLSKILLDSVQPFLLAGLLYLGAGVGLAVYGFARGNKAEVQEARLTSADMPWLALAIGMGGVVAPVLLMLGLQFTAASSAALLLNLEGIATMAIAWIVYREYVDRRLLVGAIAIMAGAVLLSWSGDGVSFNLGALLIAGACIAWGVDNNVTRQISAADPVAIATLKGLTAGIVNLGIALASGGHLPPLPVALTAAIIGFFAVGVSLVMFILALRHLGTARTGAYYSLAPFIGAMIAIVVLDEPPTMHLMVAGALMAIGLWLHLSERHDHWHEHGFIEHEHSHVHDEHHQHPHEGTTTEPHTHWHQHVPLRHKHPHYPDLHHRHGHA